MSEPKQLGDLLYEVVRSLAHTQERLNECEAVLQAITETEEKQ